MKLPFNLVAKSSQEASLIVDPNEYFIALKLGPPALMVSDTHLFEKLRRDTGNSKLQRALDADSLELMGL